MPRIKIEPTVKPPWKPPERHAGESDTEYWHAVHESYLKSDEWARKRRQVMAAQGSECRCCHSVESLQIHHLTYRRLGNEPLTDLMVLCGTCHHAITMAHRNRTQIRMGLREFTMLAIIGACRHHDRPT